MLVTGDPWQKCLLLAGAETEPCQRPKNEAANISGEKKPPSRLPPKDLLGTEDPAMHDIKDGKYDVIVWMRSTPSGSEYYAHLPVFYGKPAQMPQQGKLSHIWERAMEYLLRASLFLSTNQNCLSPPLLAPMLPTVWACEKSGGISRGGITWGSFGDLLRIFWGGILRRDHSCKLFEWGKTKRGEANAFAVSKRMQKNRQHSQIVECAV